AQHEERIDGHQYAAEDQAHEKAANLLRCIDQNKRRYRTHHRQKKEAQGFVETRSEVRRVGQADEHQGENGRVEDELPWQMQRAFFEKETQDHGQEHDHGDGYREVYRRRVKPWITFEKADNIEQRNRDFGEFQKKEQRRGSAY